MNPHDPRYHAAFSRLLTIMNELRTSCPWDRQQTLASLRHLTIEETYELSDAILAGETTEIKKELGDLLLHIVFYSKIASEQAHFDIADVIESLCDKLVRRHPHVYGDMAADDEAAIKKQWEVQKLAEQSSAQKRVFAGVPSSLPALLKAFSIQEKAKGIGFDWDNSAEVWAKVQEELAELQVSLAAGDSAHIEEEFGDVLFSLINYARFIDVNPETALERANRKFMSRFHWMEQAVQADGKQLPALSLAELDEYWEAAKAAEKAQ